MSWDKPNAAITSTENTTTAPVRPLTLLQLEMLMNNTYKHLIFNNSNNNSANDSHTDCILSNACITSLCVQLTDKSTLHGASHIVR